MTRDNSPLGREELINQLQREFNIPQGGVSSYKKYTGYYDSSRGIYLVSLDGQKLSEIDIVKACNFFKEQISELARASTRDEAAILYFSFALKLAEKLLDEIREEHERKTNKTQ